MISRFEELAWAETDLGPVSLRRRLEPTLGVEIFEVKLGDDFLMSSLFTVAEIELARLGLAAVDGAELDVMVGGLGLGYTAAATLSDSRVRSVAVVEALQPVIDWHERELLPLSAALTTDPRSVIIQDDFFAIMRGEPQHPGFDAVLLDIDHSPRQVLDAAHADFYTADGLRQLCRHLTPRGVFALWSDDPPDSRFTEVLDEVFGRTSAEVVTFDNPLTGGMSSNTVYLGSEGRS